MSFGLFYPEFDLQILLNFVVVSRSVIAASYFRWNVWHKNSRPKNTVFKLFIRGGAHIDHLRKVLFIARIITRRPGQISIEFFRHF